MKISEILKDKYKLRIPPAVFYELLADVQEAEEEQEPTTKDNLGVEKIIDEIEKEFEKVDIPIMDKLTLFAKVQNALYKCAVSNSEIPTGSTTKNDITENCIACKYDEDDDKSERCKKCLAGDSQFELDDALIESTTKNDLGVEKIVDVLGSYTDLDIPYKHKIAEDILNNLPSITPQEPKWIPVSERLPNKNQWVLVTTEDHQKLVEIMCYQGIRIGRHNVGNGWEEYEYPSWTSGHGDIQSSHPKAWMPLPKAYRGGEE